MKHSFKAYLLKLLDDSLPDEEKQRKGKKNRDAELPLALTKYIRLSNAGDA